MAPEVLLSELPPDPSKSWPLAALATYQQQVQAIKDLCQRHRGEVREISGERTQIDVMLVVVLWSVRTTNWPKLA